MIKVELILSLLRSLEQYVVQLKRGPHKSLRELVDDTLVYWGVLHGLQFAVQHVVDISSHILASQQLAAPQSYKEIIFEMGRNKIISHKLAENIEGMAGFRNVVVHQYLSVNPELVWNVVQNRLDDFTLFSDYIYDYLERVGLLGEK